MKIVYLTDQLYLHGGVEKVLSQKLNYFANCSQVAEIYLITTEQKENSFCYPIDQKVVHHDLAINYVRAKSYFHPINFFKAPKHIQKLKGILKSIQPDVLIVCNYAFDFYFIPFIGKKIKTIKEFHSSRFQFIKDIPNSSFLKKILYTINNKIENKYTHIVVLNTDEKKYYRSKNIKVIPNSVGLVKNNSVEKQHTIIAAGRIALVKQFDHLIKAWSLIAKDFPGWKVTIYGEGDELLLNELNTLIKGLVVPNIKLMGVTNNLIEKMQEASIYALTSATECFPMVLLESLSCGLPIVSYDCPNGPRNIITQGEDGVLVKYNNIEVFASQLSELIKSDTLRNKMELNAVKNIERFSEELIMKQWLDLFNKIEK